METALLVLRWCQGHHPFSVTSVFLLVLMRCDLLTSFLNHFFVSPKPCIVISPLVFPLLSLWPQVSKICFMELWLHFKYSNCVHVFECVCMCVHVCLHVYVYMASCTSGGHQRTVWRNESQFCHFYRESLKDWNQVYGLSSKHAELLNHLDGQIYRS